MKRHTTPSRDAIAALSNTDDSNDANDNISIDINHCISDDNTNSNDSTAVSLQHIAGIYFNAEIKHQRACKLSRIIKSTLNMHKQRACEASRTLIFTLKYETRELALRHIAKVYVNIACMLNKHKDTGNNENTNKQQTNILYIILYIYIYI